MDRLVLSFRETEPGARFASVWKAARNIRDLCASAFRFIIHIFKIYRKAAEIAETRRVRIL